MRYTISVGLLGIGFGVVIAVAMELFLFPFVLVEALKPLFAALGIAAGIAIVLGLMGMYTWRS